MGRGRTATGNNTGGIILGQSEQNIPKIVGNPSRGMLTKNGGALEDDKKNKSGKKS
jgi:hypothetical protein